MKQLLAAEKKNLCLFDFLITVRKLILPSGTLVSVADHATGGLALGTNYPGPSYPDPYAFFVRRLARATSSIEVLSSRIVKGQIFPFLTLINETLAVELTTGQQDELRQFQLQNDVNRFITALGEMVSASDLIAWSTWGHDAVDVNLYCAGVCPPALKGSLRNDVVGQILAEFLDVQNEQAVITAALANFNTTGHPNGWVGSN